MEEKTIVYPKKIEETANYQYKFWLNEPISTIKVDEFDNKVTMNEKYEGIFIDNIDKSIADFITKNFNDKDKTGTVTIFNTSYVNWLFGKNRITYLLKYMGNICGIINASIVDMINYGVVEKFADVNFICVHKNTRRENICILLIKKLRDALLIKGIKTGEFMSDIYIPHPVTAISSYWVPVNNPELFIKGIKNNDNKDEESMIRDDYYKNSYSHPKKDPYTMQLAEDDDYEKIYKIYKEYLLSRYKFGELYTYDEFIYKFKNSDVVKTYILLRNGIICDFISIVKTTQQINNIIFNVGKITMYTSKNAHLYIILVNLMIVLNGTNIDLLEINDTMEFDNHIMTYDLKFELRKDSNKYIYLYNTINKSLKGMKQYDICKMISL